jgi:plasmid stabilization system protein ParE
MDRRFRLHPEAARDITESWEYIANDNPRAAGRVREEILEAIRNLVRFPHQGHRRLASPTAHCASSVSGIT